MNRYSQHLGNTLLALLLGLPLGCAAGGLLIGGWGLTTETGRLSVFPGSFIFGGYIALFAVPIGALPSLLYGAPVYALLANRNIANIGTASAAGAIPGLVAIPIEPAMAGFLLVFGVCVAAATHLIAKRRLAKFRPGR